MPHATKHPDRIKLRLRKPDLIVLTAKEWERFRALLLDPPEPNDRLKRAFAEHARVVRE
jgi:uncharacterized protein (DUF1778 family)